METRQPIYSFSRSIMEEKKKLKIVGLIKETNFTVAKDIAEGLRQKFPDVFLEPEVQPLLEADWDVYLTRKKRELAGEFWEFSGSVLCFLDDLPLGHRDDLHRWAEGHFSFTLRQPNDHQDQNDQDQNNHQDQNNQDQNNHQDQNNQDQNNHQDQNNQDQNNHQDQNHQDQKDQDQNYHQYQSYYQELTKRNYRQHLRDTGHVFVYLDVEVGGELVGRLLLELFSDVCPKTCENFRALCTGERGRRSPTGPLLCYKGSLFHRVVPQGFIQGGDIGGGAGGEEGGSEELSIYGGTFQDESFCVPHSHRGILGMANRGPHTNASQFYLTLGAEPWMDRTYVAFGRLVEGLAVLQRLEKVPTSLQRPLHPCRVAACGEIDMHT